MGPSAIEAGASATTMFGVLCIYLLIGSLFAFVYGVVPSVGSGDFFAQQGDLDTTKNFLYFSFVTITTVGYGDLTAGTSLGRSLAISEALTGQIYLVTWSPRSWAAWAPAARPKSAPRPAILNV